MGYVPYMGPDVAAFTQPQVNSMQQSSDIANMFGMGPETDIASQLPPAQDYAGGIRGYSSFPLYEQSQEALGAKYPGLKSYLDSFFIDPVTGKMAPDNPWDRANAGSSSNNSTSSKPNKPRRTYIANGNEVVAPGSGRRE
jgi:hypothetical protein